MEHLQQELLLAKMQNALDSHLIPRYMLFESLQMLRYWIWLNMQLLVLSNLPSHKVTLWISRRSPKHNFGHKRRNSNSNMFFMNYSKLSIMNILFFFDKCTQYHSIGVHTGKILRISSCSQCRYPTHHGSWMHLTTQQLPVWMF